MTTSTRSNRAFTSSPTLAFLTYHAYDEAWIPAMMAGKTMEDVGKDTFGEPFDNDLLGDNPQENYGELSEKAIEAVKNIPEDELDSCTVHYTYGDYPAREALWHAIMFRAMRVHDLADVIGVNSDLPGDLVQAVWDIVEPRADEWRESVNSIFQHRYGRSPFATYVPPVPSDVCD